MRRGVHPGPAAPRCRGTSAPETLLRRAARAALSICALCALADAHPAAADTLTVFAAASLKESLDAVARQFERRDASGATRVVVAYAASSALARQIESGAPADVFISADTEWMDYLRNRGFTVASSEFILLGNQLVLIAPAASHTALHIAPGFPIAAALDTVRNGRLAIADPAAVPAGKYAKASLSYLGVWDAVFARTARAENVRAALFLVARGEAPLGVVYATDAASEPAVRVVDVFPPLSHPPIVYPAARLTASKSPFAADFLAYLKSAPAAAVWRHHGFSLPN